MSFSQLHYTSCKNGLASYDGFQFCAMTPGVPTEVMREVERLTIYEFPAEEVADPDGGGAGGRLYPVNLLYMLSETLDQTIISRIEYAGRDFSNRPGNYFAHSLVRQRHHDDAKNLLPIELWDAPFWQNARTSVSELPLLTKPLAQGPLTRTMIDDFVAASPGRNELVKALVTAADLALGADRKVMIICADTDVICFLIAAMCYLLGPHRGQRLTFATYVHDLRHARTCVVGTVPSAVSRLIRDEINSSFWVFDLTGDLPDIQSSPAAALLADRGMAASAELWTLAISLGAGPEHTLTELFPLLASAALIQGRTLNAAELNAATGWLTDAHHDLAIEQLGEALSTALRSPLLDIPPYRQQQLVELGVLVDGRCGNSPNTDASMATRIECALAQGTLNRFDSGEPVSSGFPFRNTRAEQIALAGTKRRLLSAVAPKAVTLLRWAHETGVDPGNDIIRQAGCDLVTQWLSDGQAVPNFSEVAAAWPQFRVGIVEGLARLPHDAQADFIAGSAAAALQLDDFHGQLALGEAWIVSSAKSRRIPRSTALAQVEQLRVHSGSAAPVLDDEIIFNIWGDASWTFAEGLKLLGELSREEFGGLPVSGRLSLLLRDLPREWDSLGLWAAFAFSLTGVADRIFSENDALLTAELADAGGRLKSATTANTPPDGTVDYLTRRYSAGSDYLKQLLERYLPQLMLECADLLKVLYACPEGLFKSFCGQARFAFEHGDLETRKMAILFLIMRDMEINGRGNRARDLEKQIIYPALSAWTRRDINELAREMDNMELNSGSALKLWHQKHGRRRRFPWA